MLQVQPQRRLQFVEADAPEVRLALANAVRQGLSGQPKTLPHRFLYDEVGAHLFAAVCQLPTYHLNRGETEVLHERAGDILMRCKDMALLVELGTGSALKTRILLDVLFSQRWRAKYLAIDIARDMLAETCNELLQGYPRLEITAQAGDFDTGLRVAARRERPQLVLWLGSALGNLTRTEAAAFLGGMHATFEHKDRMLVGIDTCRDPQTLLAAYDDRKGVHAAFHLNLLARINRELGGRFDLATFRHRAQFDEEMARVEVALVSQKTQVVAIDALELEVAFAEGEPIHTEWSYKYSRPDIENLCRAAGFALDRQWLDKAGQMSLNLLAPVGVAP